MISNCSFISNKATDGFAISIDGSYYNSKVEISWNTFVDNYNKETISTSFIISIESCTFSDKQILAENSFSNQENGIPLSVIEYSCNDPIGPPLEGSNEQSENEGQYLSESDISSLIESQSSSCRVQLTTVLHLLKDQNPSCRVMIIHQMI